MDDCTTFFATIIVRNQFAMTLYRVHTVSFQEFHAPEIGDIYLRKRSCIKRTSCTCPFLKRGCHHFFYSSFSMMTSQIFKCCARTRLTLHTNVRKMMTTIVEYCFLNVFCFSCKNWDHSRIEFTVFCKFIFFMMFRRSFCVFLTLLVL